MRIAVLLVSVFLPAIASAEGVPREATNSLGLKLVKIESGEFVMGTALAPPASKEEWHQRDWDESPARKVKISQSFFMSATEVTNAQYEQFDAAHKTLRGLGSASAEDGEPVTMVTWQQAVAFCEWLSKKEGQTYRLPTEAEWEFGCRAGTTTAFHIGDTLTDKQANIAAERRKRTRPVGSYAANAWGLFDMHGNVEEWCLDWYGPYAADDRMDPVGRADGYVKVTRGGSYDIPSWQKSNARFARSANRSGRLPEDANRCTGFRVVMGALPATRPLPPASSTVARIANDEVSNDRSPPRRVAVPDPKKAYFDDFKGRRATIPENTWGPIFSAHNHFAACCVCPNGDVLACWYTTKSESGRELAQAASRLAAGSDKWQPASLFFDVPDVNDHAPVLLTHKGRIYHFASQSLRGWDETTNVMRTSDDNGTTWSKPRIIFRREGPHNLSQACSAFATDDGTIALAVDGSGHRSGSLLLSRDEGKTWTIAGGDLRKAAGGKYAIHPAIARGKNRLVIAFLRGPDPMPRLISTDRGENWTASDTPFGGIGVGQKATALRLKSGALLLCTNDTRKPPITEQRGTLAALSYDDGKTWPHVRHVPGVGGYMSADQAPNGVIYLFGSRMSCAAFNEAWLKDVDDSK
jgi:sulfatase modifying factor 1